MEPETTRTAGEGARVLYADPDEAARRTAAGWLESAGYEAVAVADGFDALARVGDDPFGVVLLHARSPRLDGYRACALIKRHPCCARTPVIIIGADTGPYGKAEVRVVGADRCLSGPLTETGLLSAVRESLYETPLLIGDGGEVASGSEWMEADVREP